MVNLPFYPFEWNACEEFDDSIFKCPKKAELNSPNLSTLKTIYVYLKHLEQWTRRLADRHFMRCGLNSQITSHSFICSSNKRHRPNSKCKKNTKENLEKRRNGALFFVFNVKQNYWSNPWFNSKIVGSLLGFWTCECSKKWEPSSFALQLHRDVRKKTKIRKIVEKIDKWKGSLKKGTKNTKKRTLRRYEK